MRRKDDLLNTVSQIAGLKVEKLRILVTSREEKDIESALQGIVTGQICVRGAKIDDDIRLYVRSCLEKERSLNEWSGSVKEEIEHALVQGSDGMYVTSYRSLGITYSDRFVRFRWVYCQIEALCKCRTVPRLRKALKELPRSLDETYERILSNIHEEHAEAAQAVLRWLLVSERPLS